MATREEKSYCRICSGLCGVTLTVDDSIHRVVGIRGDKEHPLTRGYACIKGLQAVESHYGPERLLHPQKRMPDGSYASIPLTQALDEIAARLNGIIGRHGAQAVATYKGTIGFYNSMAGRMLRAWLESVGSNGNYTSMTIDQSAKFVTADRLGVWAGGAQAFAEADVWLLAGNNPLVSVGSAQMSANPTLSIKEAKERGLKLIVIDPRRTETARYADVFLQLLPGEDVTVAAGLLRIILSEGWHDREFCERFVNGVDALRYAVDAYTPELVEQRAGVPAGKLREAAELFARIGRKGTAYGATGPCMAAHSNLADHLYSCLNVVCGRFPRAGEKLANPGVMAYTPPSEQVYPPQRSWERGPRSHVGGYGMLFGERMTGILADEILTPGEGQVRSLITLGGNPVGAFPDQRKVIRAMESLDLLVTIDPYLNETGRFAHYIIPPHCFYEQANLGPLDYESSFFPKPYAAYAPAIVPPPEGSDVIEDWRVFWELSRRMGGKLTFCGSELDTSGETTAEDLYALMLKNNPVSFEEIRRRRGQLVDPPPAVVAPAPEAKGRFEVAPTDVVAELAQVLGEVPPAGYNHRLSSRRMRDVSNTMYHDFPAIRHRVRYNPAYLNPADIAALGLNPGDKVAIVSECDRIEAILEADADVRSGVVSMSHGWGGLPDDQRPYEEKGSSTSLLISTDVYLEAINAMPRMSAIPVHIVRLNA